MLSWNYHWLMETRFSALWKCVDIYGSINGLCNTVTLKVLILMSIVLKFKNVILIFELKFKNKCDLKYRAQK